MDKKNNRKKMNFFKSVVMMIIFVITMPVFSFASKAVFDKDIDKWLGQKNNIIRNIKKEIYLNNFILSVPLKEKISNLKKIFNQQKFINTIREVYMEIDKYYTDIKKFKNNEFKDLKNVIIGKINKFKKINNIKIDDKFNNDLEVLGSINNQKIFLKKLEEFFNEHINNFYLKSSKINRKINKK